MFKQFCRVRSRLLNLQHAATSLFCGSQHRKQLGNNKAPRQNDGWRRRHADCRLSPMWSIVVKGHTQPTSKPIVSDIWKLTCCDSEVVDLVATVAYTIHVNSIPEVSRTEVRGRVLSMPFTPLKLRQRFAEVVISGNCTRSLQNTGGRRSAYVLAGPSFGGATSTHDNPS